MEGCEWGVGGWGCDRVGRRKEVGGMLVGVVRGVGGDAWCCYMNLLRRRRSAGISAHICREQCRWRTRLKRFKEWKESSYPFHMSSSIVFPDKLLMSGS